MAVERGRDQAAGETLEDGHPLVVVEEEEQQRWVSLGNMGIRTGRVQPQVATGFGNAVSLCHQEAMLCDKKRNSRGQHTRTYCEEVVLPKRQMEIGRLSAHTAQVTYAHSWHRVLLASTAILISIKISTADWSSSVQCNRTIANSTRIGWR